MNGQTQTPMSDHVAYFWQLLATEHVRILIDIRRDHDEGQPPHWDSSSFPNDVAKALVADHYNRPIDREVLRRKIGRIIDPQAFETILPASSYDALRKADAIIALFALTSC